MGISVEKPGIFSCRQNGKIREGKGLVCHSAESCDVLSDKMEAPLGYMDEKEVGVQKPKKRLEDLMN